MQVLFCCITGKIMLMRFYTRMSVKRIAKSDRNG